MIDLSLSLALGRTDTLHVPPSTQQACANVAMQLHRRQSEARSFGVTSAQAREGRSTIAAGLAIALAMTIGRRSVLLDLNPLRPGPTSDRPAFPEGGVLDVSDAIEWVIPDLGVLSARLWPSTNGTLTRLAARDIVEQLRALDVTLIADLPLAPPIGHADRYADLFDSVVLVVRAGSTPVDLVRRAADSLPDPLVVLNGTSSAIPRWLQGVGRR